jgi:PQQ-like domain
MIYRSPCGSILAFISLFLVFLHPISAQAPAYPPNPDVWSGWGANIYNSRWASNNSVINSTTIPFIKQNCKLTYPIGVSANPVILNTTAYYPTWNGSFVALDYTTCKVIWDINVQNIVLKFGAMSPDQANATLPVSRTSPMIDGDVLYFGTQSQALLVAVDLATGNFLGYTQINANPMAVISMSPTIYQGTIFVGTGSQEEVAATIPGYTCCSFIGNFAAVTFDRSSGKFTTKWTFESLPSNEGWAGAGIWGSQPPIDPNLNQVFIGTGNVYTYPDQYAYCKNESSTCLPANVYEESVIALDIGSGKVNWVNKVSPLDAFTMACYGADPPSTCSTGPSTDADFGMLPIFVPAALSGAKQDMVVIGQKSGAIFAFASNGGANIWTSSTSPGSDWGGLSFGMAVDNAQVYFTAINYGKFAWNLQPSGVTIQNSAFGSAELSTGKILWETQVPQGNMAYSPPITVGDLVLVARAGIDAAVGSLMALSKTNGSILLDYPTDSTMRGGVTVAGQYLLFGTGYDYSAGDFTSGSLYVMQGPIAPPVSKDPGVAFNPTSTLAPGASPSGTGKATNKKSAATSTRTPQFTYLCLAIATFLWLAKEMI